MRFEKGRAKTGGRQKGVRNRDTRNYLDFQLWFGMIKDCAETLEPKEKLEVAFRVMSMLMTKVQQLPGTPEQSLENAMAREAAMGALEKADQPVEGENAVIA